MLANVKSFGNRKRPWQWFRPDYMVQTVAEIDFAYLRRKGIKVLFIDLDGTVVERGSFEVSDAIKKVLRNQPLDVYIATNRPKSRNLKNLKDDLHASGVIHPSGVWAKPSRPYYHKALRSIGVRPSEAAMAGDRYIQDILGANGAGMHTILVRKLGPSAGRGDRLLSSLEERRSRKLAEWYQPLK